MDYELFSPKCPKDREKTIDYDVSKPSGKFVVRNVEKIGEEKNGLQRIKTAGIILVRNVKKVGEGPI